MSLSGKIRGIETEKNLQIETRAVVITVLESPQLFNLEMSFKHRHPKQTH